MYTREKWNLQHLALIREQAKEIFLQGVNILHFSQHQSDLLWLSRQNFYLLLNDSLSMETLVTLSYRMVTTSCCCWLLAGWRQTAGSCSPGSSGQKKCWSWAVRNITRKAVNCTICLRIFEIAIFLGNKKVENCLLSLLDAALFWHCKMSLSSVWC